jgi:hypothetical protein
MSEFGPQRFDARLASSGLGGADDIIRVADSKHGASLRYSSPLPWVLSLAISLSMWAFIAWIIWGR